MGRGRLLAPPTVEAQGFGRETSHCALETKDEEPSGHEQQPQDYIDPESEGAEDMVGRKLKWRKEDHAQHEQGQQRHAAYPQKGDVNDAKAGSGRVHASANAAED